MRVRPEAKASRSRVSPGSTRSVRVRSRAEASKSRVVPGSLRTTLEIVQQDGQPNSLLEIGQQIEQHNQSQLSQ
jgi:hypothetical protein